MWQLAKITRISAGKSMKLLHVCPDLLRYHRLMGTRRTVQALNQGWRRPGVVLIVGGGVGFAALSLYLAERHERSPTVAESIVWQGSLFLLLIATLAGIVRWLNSNPKYPYKTLWRISVTVWGSGFIAGWILTSIWPLHSPLLIGAICGICAFFDHRFGKVRR